MGVSQGLFAIMQIVPLRDSEGCSLVAVVTERKMRLGLVNVDIPVVIIAHYDGRLDLWRKYLNRSSTAQILTLVEGAEEMATENTTSLHY